MQARIQALVASGVPLDKASAQARSETGQLAAPGPNNVYLGTYNPTTGQNEYSAGPSKGPPNLTPLGVAKAQTAGAGGMGSGPVMARVGQFGEMLKKLPDLYAAMENLDVGLGPSAAQDIAEHGVHVPLVGTLPGSKGVGSALVNRTPQFAQYQAALAPAVLAAAHAMSGARINQGQLDKIQSSIELKPGDFRNPNVRAQKEKNLIDLVNSIGGSLPAQGVAGQEAQMDPTVMDAMVAKGYRRSAGGATPVASPASGGKTVVINGKTYRVP
jgi:hypothetical protein